MIRVTCNTLWLQAKYIALISTLCVNASLATQTPAVWDDHIGSHYSERSWAKAVRDFQGPGAAGINYPDTNSRSNRVSVRVPSADVDSLIFNIGGLGSGRDEGQVVGFMKAVHTRGGSGWKDSVRERVLQFAEKYKRSDVNIYWQFGNEINSGQFSRSFHQWAGEGYPEAHDKQTIPWYVEYYLAPGVEGVLEARKRNPEYSSKLNIVLGSIAVARNPRSVEWMNALLGYQIKGDYAPTLKGKRVADYIDVVSLHYLVGTPGDGWRTILDDIHRQWLGSGTINAIWSTEEIGIRRAREGFGAATAMQVLARYMSWWSANNIDAKAGKVFFWGSDVGSGLSQADFVLNQIKANFPSDKLIVMEGKLDVQGHGDIEYYHYRSASMPNKQLIVVFPRERTSIQLSQIGVQAESMPSRINAEMFLLNPKSDVRYKLAVDKINDKYILKMSSAVDLPQGAAIVFVLSP